MKIAFFSSKPYDQEYFEQFNKELDLTFFETPLTLDTVRLTKGFNVVCIFVNDKADEAIIQELFQNGIRLIALRCAGFNNVDLDAAKKLGISVVRVPAYSPEAIAEHSLAIMLTLNRKTHKAYNRIREGNFSLNRLIGFNLYGKTVGVIGTGKIGIALCRILKGFGCKIIAYDPFPNDKVIQLGGQYISLQELFEQADIISLHCPLTPDTKHMINKQSIQSMKDGVMLINTSRGALVNTADAIEGLSNRKIGYLGIDVYEQEEHIFYKDLSESIIDDDYILRLNSFPNVLITSHQAYFTKEAMEEITMTTLKNIEAFAKGEVLKNAVN